MTQQAQRPDKIPLFFIAAFAIAWSALVAWLVFSPGQPSELDSPLQRIWAAAPLAVVGAVICALGYMSMLKRRAMRRSRSSLDRLLEQRRQKPL